MGEVGFPFAQHVPDDRKVGAEDATQRLEDGVCTKWDVVPCKVGVAVTENHCKA